MIWWTQSKVSFRMCFIAFFHSTDKLITKSFSIEKLNIQVDSGLLSHPLQEGTECISDAEYLRNLRTVFECSTSNPINEIS